MWRQHVIYHRRFRTEQEHRTPSIDRGKPKSIQECTTAFTMVSSSGGASAAMLIALNEPFQWPLVPIDVSSLSKFRNGCGLFFMHICQFLCVISWDLVTSISVSARTKENQTPGREN